MAKTLVDIPDDLMEQARDVVGPGATKTETVREGLRLLVRRQRQLEAINWIAENNPFLSEEELAQAQRE